MTPERLAEIKADPICLACCVEEQPCLVPELLAEVERLTAKLAEAVQYLQGEPLPEAMKRCVEEAVNRRLVAAVAEQDRLRGLVIKLREYGCSCDLMNGVRCGIHSIV